MDNKSSANKGQNKTTSNTGSCKDVSNNCYDNKTTGKMQNKKGGTSATDCK